MDERKGKKKVERGGWGIRDKWGERRERENMMAPEVTHHSCAPLLLLHCIKSTTSVKFWSSSPRHYSSITHHIIIRVLCDTVLYYRQQ